jgi:hypothetical protein
VKIKCVTCQRVISKSYDVDPSTADVLGRPWYRDEGGLNHLAIVCLHCGTIHDCSGSILKGLLSGFQSALKVHDDLNPMELAMLVMQHTAHLEADSRRVAIEKLGIPAAVLDVLVERKILGPAFRRGG